MHHAYMYSIMLYTALWDQLFYMDPAHSDFWEPAGDSTYLVHCKGRFRGQARARAGARGWKRQA